MTRTFPARPKEPHQMRSTIFTSVVSKIAEESLQSAGIEKPVGWGDAETKTLNLDIYFDIKLFNDEDKKPVSRILLDLEPITFLSTTYVYVHVCSG